MNTIKVPSFIYRIIKIKANNEGLAFVTTNNPFLAKSTEIRELCSRSLCKHIPDFLETSKGYTYCCPVTEFTDNLRRIYKMQLKGIHDVKVPANVNEALLAL